MISLVSLTHRNQALVLRLLTRSQVGLIPFLRWRYVEYNTAFSTLFRDPS